MHTEIRDLLIETASNLNRQLESCEEGLALLNKVLKAIEPESTTDKPIKRITERPIYAEASGFLLAKGLLNEKQVSHKDNQAFINLCDGFIDTYGSERFNKVLDQVSSRKNVRNIYAYITRALTNEVRQG